MATVKEDVGVINESFHSAGVPIVQGQLVHVPPSPVVKDAVPVPGTNPWSLTPLLPQPMRSKKRGRMNRTEEMCKP